MTEQIASLDQLVALAAEVQNQTHERAAQGHTQIRICMGASCIASGAVRVKESLTAEIQEQGLADKTFAVN